MSAAKPGPDLFAGLKGIIFDCDGVLVDSLGANRLYYNMILARLGLAPMTPDEEAYVHAHHVQDSVARIVPAHRLAEAEAARAAIDYRDVLPGLLLNPGLRPLLAELARAGCRLAINTNRSDTMELLLDHFELNGVFEPVVTAAVVSRPKPHPEGVLRILAAWDCAPEEAAFVGDTDLDELAARAAGVRFWSFGQPELPAQAALACFDDLRRALRLWLDREIGDEDA